MPSGTMLDCLFVPTALQGMVFTVVGEKYRALRLGSEHLEDVLVIYGIALSQSCKE